MQPLLKKYNIAEHVLAFSTTRHGGVSKGSYGEFNINAYCGDDPQAITANRKALTEEIGIEDNHLLMPHQVHGTRNLTVTKALLTMPAEQRQRLLEGTDSLTTNLKGVCIGVSTADCIPILLYDKRHHATAAIHAGWRGTVARIAISTIREMQAVYDTQPEDITAIIGPGISLKNFETGNEVYGQFKSKGFEMSSIACQYPSRHEPGKLKWHINLPLCNQQQLLEAGIKKDNIAVSAICTYDQVNDYFSARRLGQASGRIYTGIIIK